MRTIRSGWLIATSLVWAAWLSLPAMLAAGGYCNSGDQASGNCQIFSPLLGSSCGGSAWKLGPVCAMTDPTLWKGGATTACANGNAQVGWAILRFHSVGETPPMATRPRPAEVTVVRASTPEFGEFAAAWYKDPPFASPQWLAPDLEILFAAQPLACPRIWVQWVQASSDQHPILAGAGADHPEVVYFRAQTDGLHLVSFEALHSEASAQDVARLFAYAKENITVRLWTEHGLQPPLDVFGSLTVTNGQVGYVFAAGNPIDP